jgi:hypothetical protein
MMLKQTGRVDTEIRPLYTDNMWESVHLATDRPENA